MAIVIGDKIVVNGDVVGTVREYEDAPRKYVIKRQGGK